jgi:RHS repeat-associated protein
VYYDGSYAPFGESYNETGTADRAFTGQNQDTSTDATSGLYDFLFREYRPAYGRWVSPDPAGLAAVNFNNPQSLNRYAYVMNNPMSNLDPFGLCSVMSTIVDSHGFTHFIQTMVPRGFSFPTSQPVRGQPA